MCFVIYNRESRFIVWYRFFVILILRKAIDGGERIIFVFVTETRTLKDTDIEISTVDYSEIKHASQ